MSVFHRFDAVMGRLYHHLGTAVGVSIGLFAVAISVDLFLRASGLGSLAGVQEVIEYALFAGVFLSAPWALRLGAHVRVDLLLSGLPARAGAVLDRFLDAFGLLVCLVLVWFGGVNWSQAYAFQSMQMKYFNVPEWWLLTVFEASFALLAVEFLSRLIRGSGTPDAASEATGGA